VKFPDGFLWGVSTSAFQIEGSLEADGRGPSIWDDFPSEHGETGAVACDHYRRWREDVDLIASLGVNAYRFSIAWPRILPDGRRIEQRGVDHYARLIDALLERGIEPVVTLYHWDLPAAFDWRDRDTVERFAEFAATCFDAYGDRVRWWLTINEPWIVGLLGYLHGLHAPGYSGDVRGEATVFHHLLLAHGRVAPDAPGTVGIPLSLYPHYPLSPADEAAARASDGYVNRWFLDPLLRGSYPPDMQHLYEQLLGPLDFVHDGDLETIASRCDFVGVNYYSRRLVEAAAGDGPFPWRVVVPGNIPETEAGTEIVPAGLTDLLVRLHDDYRVPTLVTENGAVYSDEVHDERRIRFLREHLAAVHAAIERGVNVLGYCHWSLMDNFEWKLGYAQRFGLVHVDYASQRRTVKDSGRVYAGIARANGWEDA
jgi:beta-glucosidase